MYKKYNPFKYSDIISSESDTETDSELEYAAEACCDDSKPILDMKQEPVGEPADGTVEDRDTDYESVYESDCESDYKPGYKSDMQPTLDYSDSDSDSDSDFCFHRSKSLENLSTSYSWSDEDFSCPESSSD